MVRPLGGSSLGGGCECDQVVTILVAVGPWMQSNYRFSSIEHMESTYLCPGPVRAGFPASQPSCNQSVMPKQTLLGRWQSAEWVVFDPVRDPRLEPRQEHISALMSMPFEMNKPRHCVMIKVCFQNDTKKTRNETTSMLYKV